MNELLQSIKADLTSRRLAPLLVLAAVALLGASAYAALGGGGSSKPPATVAAVPVPGGLPVSIAPPSATAAAAETPGGAHYQTHDPARDPFLAFAMPATAAGVGNSSGVSSGASGGASRPAGATSPGGGSASGPSRTTPTPSPPAPAGKAAPKATLKPEPLPVYSVSVMFGLAPATPEQQPTLTPYEDLKRFEPIPSAKVPLLVFLGVLKTGGKAVFAFTAPPILRGPATCYPSATQCQAIALAAGQSEELEYLKRSGEAVTFELKVVKISRRSTPTGAARALRQSKAGRRALLRAGLWTLP